MTVVKSLPKVRTHNTKTRLAVLATSINLSENPAGTLIALCNIT